MNHLDRALRSLDGLSIGDAFGQRLSESPGEVFQHRSVPLGPWPWTDDTHMAMSVVEVLLDFDEMNSDALSKAFVRRYREEPHRGYGAGAHKLLSALQHHADWRVESKALFGGSGSFGNGAAMRAAPIGAWFANHVARAADEARLSAVVTHAHTEGIAGAIAVAVATALRYGADHPRGVDFLSEVQRFVPRGSVYDGIAAAAEIPAERLSDAATTLGSGQRVSAADTVPFCLWVAAFHGEGFEDALWMTAAARGDVDTTCAIVGGILGGSGIKVPAAWRAARESLPPQFQLAELSED